MKKNKIITGILAGVVAFSMFSSSVFGNYNEGVENEKNEDGVQLMSTSTDKKETRTSTGDEIEIMESDEKGKSEVVGEGVELKEGEMGITSLDEKKVVGEGIKVEEGEVKITTVSKDVKESKNNKVIYSVIGLFFIVLIGVVMVIKRKAK